MAAEIEVNPEVMMGKPVVAGTRVTVEHILAELGAGRTIDELVAAHPRLTREAILAALRFASRTEDLEAQALKLAPTERAQLADRLIASLSEDGDLEEAWSAEVERRIQEVESGRAELVPAADAISRARAAIK